MKNLANCKPSEFLRQTSKIKKSVEKWLKVTDIMSIRNTKPTIPDGATQEEKEKALNAQARENISRMLDEIMEKHPDETLELLALVCFIDPENVDDYPVSEYLSSINELLQDEAVAGFFSSFIQWGQTIT